MNKTPSLPAWRRAVKSLASLQLTLVCILLLMAVVLLCTLDQVKIGIFAAVKRDIRSFFLYWQAAPGLRIPYFPGGALVGGVLLANLAAAFYERFTWERRKAGIWLVHLGIVLLVAGEFVTGFFAEETQMAILEGQTLGYTESTRRVELAVIDGSDPSADEVFAVREEALKPGREFTHPRWPFTLKLKDYFENSTLERKGAGDAPAASAGIGTALAVRRAPPAFGDDQVNQAAAFVEALEGGRSLGVFLLSNGLGAPQSFFSGGKEYRLFLRMRRRPLPFTLTLQKFKRVMYPGTDIPKSFSSLVRLVDPSRGEDRDVLIYMNNPLRYANKAFYQASFGKDDKLSVLQVVENPGWLLPYLACLLASLGLAVQFYFTFSASRAKA